MSSATQTSVPGDISESTGTEPISKQRVTAAGHVRIEIRGLSSEPDGELGESSGKCPRLSVRLVVQSALEAEVTEFIPVSDGRGNSTRARHRNG